MQAGVDENAAWIHRVIRRARLRKWIYSDVFGVDTHTWIYSDVVICSDVFGVDAVLTR